VAQWHLEQQHTVLETRPRFTRNSRSSGADVSPCTDSVVSVENPLPVGLHHSDRLDLLYAPTCSWAAGEIRYKGGE
jgi:hypothetical protein